MKAANTPPDKPLASEDVGSAIDSATRPVAAILWKWGLFIPVLYYRTFSWLYYSILYLGLFLDVIYHTCRKVEHRKIDIHPNPCDTYTLDFYMEWAIRDFNRLAEHARIDVPIEKRGKEFLESLRKLSSVCVQVTGVNCLKYASPEGVVPVPLRAYILDLVSAIRFVGNKFLEAYRDVREWRVGHVRLYEHPKATGELAELAEYIANILHKMIEIGMVSPKLKDEILVLSDKDMIEVTISDLGHVILEPRWIINTYGWSEDDLEIVKRVLTERGFGPEKTDYGLRVSATSDNVAEAVKIICLLPAIPSPSVHPEGREGAYKDTMSKLELLESRLKEQKPLKKRRGSL